MQEDTLKALQCFQQLTLGSAGGKHTEFHLQVKNALFPGNPHLFSSSDALRALLFLPQQPGSRPGVQPSDITSVFLQMTHFTLATTWRLSKRVYTFDPDFFEVLTSTPSVRSLPASLLQQLPDWGFFVEFPEKYRYKTKAGDLLGFFVHVDAELLPAQKTKDPLLYTQEDFRKLGIRKEAHLLQQLSSLFCLKAPVYYLSFLHQHGVINAAMALSPDMDFETLEAIDGETGEVLNDPDDVLKDTLFLSRMLNIVMYLCSVKADYQRPAPLASRSSKKHQYHPAPQVQTLPVGFRMGAALRAARQAHLHGQRSKEGEGLPVTPHMRSPHWHLYWTGPRSAPQIPVVHWLPPIAVKMQLGDETVPTSHRVLAGAKPTPDPAKLSGT